MRQPSTSSAVAVAVAFATVKFVRSALARPHAAVDGTRNSDCNADDGANDHHGDQDADGQPLVLAQTSPSVLHHSAAASTVLSALLLVGQAGLSQGLVCRPHCAFLSAGADGTFLAERVLFVVVSTAGVWCGIAVFEVFLGCEVSGLGRSGLDAFVRGGRVGVEGRVYGERRVVGVRSIVQGDRVP
jgi:hypothetical protein